MPVRAPVGARARLVVVPVEVVLGDVEHDGRLRGHRAGVVELEAGELDGEDVVGLGVHHGLDDRQADVADRDGAEPGGVRIDWSICTVVVLPLVPVTASHGAAASGSRSRHASSTSPQTGIAALGGLGEQRRGRLPARRGDDQVDVVGQHAGRARLEPDGRAEASRAARPSPPSRRWWTRRAPSPARRGRAGCRRRRSRRRRSRRPRRVRRTSRWCGRGRRRPPRRERAHPTPATHSA